MNLKLFKVFGMFLLLISFMVFTGNLYAEETVTEEKVVSEETPKVEEKSSWAHESELGISLSGGNSDSKSINFKQMTSYAWGMNLIRLDALFLYGYANGAESARNWMGGLRYERVITNMISAYLGHSWEGDVYAGYDYRANSDIGAKIYFLKKDDKSNYFFNETGYRFRYEDRITGTVSPTSKDHIIRVYFEKARDLTSFLFWKTWVEFLFDMTNKSNIQINFEPSLNVLLSNVFSLKLGFLGKFDNEPAQAGLTTFDYLYTTALVAKF